MTAPFATLVLAAVLAAPVAPRPVPAVAAVPAVPASAVPAALEFGRFGRLPVYAPPPAAGSPAQVVLLLTGKPGEPETARTAAALAAWGAVVLVVDVPRYLATAEKGRGKCTYPAADFESLAHFAEQRLGLPRYIPPLLVGDAGGAALAYVTLAQAPPFTFQGAVSDGFCREMRVSRPFCQGNDLRNDESWGGPTLRLAPATGLEVPWIVLDRPDAGCPAGRARDFAAQVPSARVLKALKAKAGSPGAGPDPALLRRAFDLFADARRQEAALAAAFGDVQDLPLIEVPAERKAPPALRQGPARDVFALILSGDGGWVGLDRKIGRHLADLGMPVVGWNTLKYFWTPRDPDAGARDLARILTHYFKAWGKRRVILAGYSQGADVLPFLVSRLPPELRARVALVTLLGPDDLATFDFDFGGWMAGRQRRPDLPVLPEIPRLAGTRVLCFYPESETASPCRKVKPGTAVAVEVPGGHAFGRDIDAITDRMLHEIGLPRSPR